MRIKQIAGKKCADTSHIWNIRFVIYWDFFEKKQWLSNNLQDNCRFKRIARYKRIRDADHSILLVFWHFVFIISFLRVVWLFGLSSLILFFVPSFLCYRLLPSFLWYIISHCLLLLYLRRRFSAYLPLRLSSLLLSLCFVFWTHAECPAYSRLLTACIEWSRVYQIIFR